MAHVKLTQGRVAIVDNEDFDTLVQYRWQCAAGGYAVRTITKAKNKRGSVYMHRVIANVPDGLECDHINQNKLDNRKCNLRTATGTQNKWNRSCRKDSVIQRRGVQRKGNTIYAEIKVNKQRFYLGSFPSVDKAADAYLNAAKYYYGDFAPTN